MCTIAQIKILDEELRGMRHGRITSGVYKARHRAWPWVRWYASFFSEVNSIRGNLGGHGLGHGRVASRGCKSRHEAWPCGMWCVQSLVIFEIYEEVRGLWHGRGTSGRSCTTKINCKFEHPNVGIRLWLKHESCREHLKVLVCQIWRCSNIV